jgi:aspartate dehydrogenase
MVRVSKSVGIIGCGTIGTELALAIDTGRVKNASLVALFDGVNRVALSLQYRLRNNNPRTFTDFEEFISSSSFRDTDIIVESASQDAIRRFSKKIVENGKSLIVMSVGALSDPPFLSELLDIASHNSARIYVPTGAIAGIDAVRSVKHLLDSVSLTTTKNPKALADAPFFNISGIDLYAITKKTLIYEGPASDAVKKFPANVNVAAILSLAGIGLEKTNVKIIVDPYTNINQHEIIASGKFGEMMVSVRNLPSPTNPKTSFLAILSAIECLRSVCDEGIRIGT